MLSDKMQFLKPSMTLQKNLEIQQLKATGKNIISLITGEPSFCVPNYIKKATIQAVKQSNNKYTSSSGLLSLRQAIADKYNILCINDFIKNRLIHIQQKTFDLKNNFNINQFANSYQEIYHYIEKRKIVYSFSLLFNKKSYKNYSFIDNFNKYISNFKYILKKPKFAKEDIVVSNGTKHSIFNLFSVLLNKDDEVIIPIPAWPSYAEIAKSLYANVKFLPFKQDFLFDINYLKSSITSKTKILVLNSPNNPTGNIYSENFMCSILQILEQNPQVYILIDEIYSDIIFEDEFKSLAILNEKMLLRIFIVNGFSKKYAMMGWRIGWIISKNTTIINAIIKLQSQTTGNVCNIAQIAACATQEIENKLYIMSNNYQHKILSLQYYESLLNKYSAYNELDINCAIKFLTASKKQYQKALQYSYNILSKNKNIKIIKPKGAFYLFCDISFFIEKKLKIENIHSINEALELICDEILHKHNIAILPGTEFKASNYIRISIAGDINEIKAGCEILLQYFNSF